LVMVVVLFGKKKGGYKKHPQKMGGNFAPLFFPNGIPLSFLCPLLLLLWFWT